MKGSSQFHFKQFSVEQRRSTHKVGTDGVLLGAWVGTGGAKRILEIGTGSGVIALMLAQRTVDDVRIDAVEIGKDDAEQARENVAASLWKHRIMVHHTAIQRFEGSKPYDLIVTNPPFFSNSLLPPDTRRRLARHTDELSFDELLSATATHLATGGRLALILPVDEAERFKKLASNYRLSCVRECAFRTRPGRAIERLLMEFSPSNGMAEREELMLYDEQGHWTTDYRRLTGDFYLKF